MAFAPDAPSPAGAQTRVFVQSFGCSANVNDGEIMEGMLQQSGKRIVRSADEADVVVLNTCTVKGKTESHIKNLVRKMQAEHPEKKLIIGGCMAQAQGAMLADLAPRSPLIGPHQIEDIVQVVDSGEVLRRTDKKAGVKVGMPKVRANPVINIVQINEGCLGACTFCITKLAKPKLLSYPMGEIAREVQRGVRDGCAEVWLTSQDTAAYGREFRRSLPQLMAELERVEGDFMVRIGMMNPDNISGMEAEMVRVLQTPRVFKFLHIPVQAGSDAVLARMHRAYTISDFRRIVRHVRARIPRLSIASDIICGFPGETEEQFQETLALVREIGFDVLNISRYWERPGTASSRMDGALNGRITKERSTRLAAAFHESAAQRNARWVGWEGEILIDEKGKAPGTWIGRNAQYKPVVVRDGRDLLGSRVWVRVSRATWFDLRADIIPTPVLLPLMK